MVGLSDEGGRGGKVFLIPLEKIFEENQSRKGEAV